MTSGREKKDRTRARGRRKDAELVEAKRKPAEQLESTFEIAHVTWSSQLIDRHETLLLGWASEPMS